MDGNDQREQNQQNGQFDQKGQGSPYGQNSSYGNSMPPEIPIPDIKGADDRTVSPHDAIAYGPQEQQYIPQKPRKGTGIRILLAVAGVVLAVFALVGIGVACFRSTAAYKLGKGLQNLGREMAQSRNPLVDKLGLEDILLMMAEEGSYVSTQFNFSSEELYGVTVGIDTECYKNVRDKQLSAETSMSMMNYEFAHLNIYADEEALCFSIPELFLEDMYIENEDVVSQYNGSILTDLTGYSDAEDFSIDFFSEGESLSLRDWAAEDSFLERYRDTIEACQKKVVLEKAEKGFYRVVYPEKEMNDLVGDMMDSYESVYEMTSEGAWWKEYDRIVASDISVLFEINRQNRIESIAFERPVKLLDGTASMEGSLHFLGSGRSVDKMQGEMVVDGADGVERSLHFQILQTPSEDTLRMDMDIDLMEEQDSLLRMKYVMNSDAVKDRFDMNFSIWDDTEDMEFIVEGSLEDIVRGRSLELELDKLAMNMDGEELFKVTGSFAVEPFDGEVSSTVRKKTAFFGMTEDDWLEIAYRIDDEYGGLMNYLSYLLW